MEQYDLIVIGAGPAGSSCAEHINEAGLRVALVERNRLGGTCLNYGCDPTKTALFSAQVLHQARYGEPLGVHAPDISASWTDLQSRIREVQNEMRGGPEEESRKAMRERGIDLIIGEASFASPHEIVVNGRTLQAERFLIATGTKTAVPDIPGLAETGYVTNKEILYLPTQPASLGILGAGPIGIEFAQLFNRLGTRVSLFETEPRILPKDDAELAATLKGVLVEEGVEINVSANVQRVSEVEGQKQLTVRYENGYEQRERVDELLVATGRQSAIGALNLETAGVKLAAGNIWIDECLVTSVPHIWAAGDVSGSLPFTHVANRQGEHVAESILAGEKRPFTAHPIPWVTFTDPEMAHVGQTEAQLQEAGTAYTVYDFSMKDVARAMTTGQTEGRIKVLVADNEQILGGHILAAHAGELIGIITLAMQAELPVTALTKIVLPYPTMSSAISKIS